MLCLRLPHISTVVVPNTTTFTTCHVKYNYSYYWARKLFLAQYTTELSCSAVTHTKAKETCWVWVLFFTFFNQQMERICESKHTRSLVLMAERVNTDERLFCQTIRHGKSWMIMDCSSTCNLKVHAIIFLHREDDFFTCPSKLSLWFIPHHVKIRASQLIQSWYGFPFSKIVLFPSSTSSRCETLFALLIQQQTTRSQCKNFLLYVSQQIMCFFTAHSLQSFLFLLEQTSILYSSPTKDIVYRVRVSYSNKSLPSMGRVE